MEIESSSLSAKEATMFGYTFRVNHNDGTFSVVTIDATSIDAAKVAAEASFAGDVESSMLLGTIDRKPAVFLAW